MVCIQVTQEGFEHSVGVFTCILYREKHKNLRGEQVPFLEVSHVLKVWQRIHHSRHCQAGSCANPCTCSSPGLVARGGLERETCVW
jgi:hypothetical protein